MGRISEELYGAGTPNFSLCVGGARAVVDLLEVSEKASREGAEKTITYRLRNVPLLLTATLRRTSDVSVVWQSVSICAERNCATNLSNLAILDLAFPHPKASDSILYGTTGGFWDADVAIPPNAAFPPAGLRSWSKELRIGAAVEIDSDLSGRSSNKEIPIWLCSLGNHGLWFGPEWSGCWNLKISRTASAMRITLALPTLGFSMLQGEQVFLPTMAVGEYNGSIEDGYNKLRHDISTHYAPAIDNLKPKAPVVFQGLAGFPTYQDEPTLYREVDQAARVGCEVFVLDAGWNTSPRTDRWWDHVGNWEPHPERFPRGFARFSEYVHTKGMKLGIWIEPRAHETSDSFRDFPSMYLTPHFDARSNLDGLKFIKERNYLLDLSRDAAQEYFYGVLDALISRHKADWIWFDFNTDPRTLYWDHFEEANRRGLLELAFYQGLYKVFDRIREKHPNVWLETCASGGRMIDLGQLRRFHSIWINDQSVDYDQNRNYRGCLNLLLPAVYLQSGFFVNWDVIDKIPKKVMLHAQHLVVSFGGVFQFGQGLCFWDQRDIATAREYVAAYKSHRDCLEKDFYRLFPLPSNKDTWDGWQFGDTLTGVLAVFRLAGSQQDRETVILRGVDPSKKVTYEPIIGDVEVSGAGTSPTLSLAPGGAALVSYKTEP